MMSRKQTILVFIAGILLSLSAFWSVTSLLRHIGDLIRLLGPAFDMSARDIKSVASIFDQLRHATIRLPVIFTLLLSTGSSWLIHVPGRPKRKAVRITLKCCLAPLLLIILFLSTLLLAEVNGIRVANLLISLLPLLTS